MPKARKKLKTKLKARLKKRIKAKAKRPSNRDRERGSLSLLTSLIDRLGASVSRDKKGDLVVSHFNHPSFKIDLNKLRIVEVTPLPESPATNVEDQPSAS